MISRLDHIDLKTANFEKTVQMFQTLGMKIVRDMPERGSVEMALPGENQVVFEVRRMKEGDVEGIHHVAFKSDSPEDLEMVKANSDVKFVTEHVLIKHTGRTVSTFVDINGLNWQLTD